MRVNEFVEKYGVPYQIAYNSTWLVKQDFQTRANRNYDEEQLKEAVTEFLNQRMKRHRAVIEKSEQILERMNAVTKI